jgi:hypothetical protein
MTVKVNTDGFLRVKSLRLCTKSSEEHTVCIFKAEDTTQKTIICIHIAVKTSNLTSKAGVYN